MLCHQSDDDRVNEADDEAETESTDSNDGFGDGKRVETFNKTPDGTFGAEYEDEGELADDEDSDGTDVDTPNRSENSEADHEYQNCKYSTCRTCVLPTQQYRTLPCQPSTDRPTKAEKQEPSPYAALRATSRVAYDDRTCESLRTTNCDVKDAHLDRNELMSKLAKEMNLSSEDAEIVAQFKDLNIIMEGLGAKSEDEPRRQRRLEHDQNCDPMVCGDEEQAAMTVNRDRINRDDEGMGYWGESVQRCWFTFPKWNSDMRVWT